MKLSDKQKRFVEEYLVDNNASRAYVAAGYSSKHPDKNSYKLLKKPEIAEYIKSVQKATSERLEIKKEDILIDLIEIKDNNKQSNPNTSIKSIEVLNKMLGFNEPEKQEVKHEGLSIQYIKPNKNE